MSTLFSYFTKASSRDAVDDSAGKTAVSGTDATCVENHDADVIVVHDSNPPRPTFSAACMSPADKKSVVEYAEAHSVNAACEHFPGLSRATVRRWVEAVREAMKQARAACLPGAAVMSISYEKVFADKRKSNGRSLPEIALERAFDRFCEARSKGVPVSTATLRQIVLSEVSNVDPSIVYSTSNTTGWFKCSNNWLRMWKQANQVSRRRATAPRRAGITDMEEIRQLFLYRVAYVVRQHGIIPALTFHADETGVLLHPTPGSTLDFVGEKSVQVVGQGDKRQATVMLGGDLTGKVLNPQVVFEGKTAAVLAPEVPGIVQTHTPNHWASFESTVQWLGTVLVPHAMAVKCRLSLPADYPCLLIWDVWHQHRSRETLEYIRMNFPWIKIVYVPANTTGALQIADVSMNKPLKSFIQDKLSKHMLAAFEEGENYKLPIADLRKQLVQWVREAADHIETSNAVTNGARKVGLDHCFTESMGLEAQVKHQLGDLWASFSKNDAVAVKGGTEDLVYGKGEGIEDEDDALSIPMVAMTESEAASTSTPSTSSTITGAKRRRKHQVSVHCSICWKRGHNRRGCPSKKKAIEVDDEA